MHNLLNYQILILFFFFCRMLDYLPVFSYNDRKLHIYLDDWELNRKFASNLMNRIKLYEEISIAIFVDCVYGDSSMGSFGDERTPEARGGYRGRSDALGLSVQVL